MRFNQLYPPFDNVAVRRAMLSAIDQAAAMQAVAGSDPGEWTDRIGIFGPAMPLASDAGIEVMTRTRDLERAKRELAVAGYRGEPIRFMDPTDAAELHALNLVGADALRQAGFNVDVAAMDFGGVARQRFNREPPDKMWMERHLHADGQRLFIHTTRSVPAPRKWQGWAMGMAGVATHRGAVTGMV